MPPFVITATETFILFTISDLIQTQRLLSQPACIIHCPSTSQGFVKSHQIQCHQLIALDQGILSLVESALGLQHANEIGEPMTI
jgi:hypothetical protein